MGFHFNPTVLSVFLSVSTCVNFFKQLQTVSQISNPSSFVSQISDPNFLSQIPQISVSQTKFGSLKALIFLFAHNIHHLTLDAESRHLQGTCWIKCRRWDLMALFAQLCQLPWDLRLNLLIKLVRNGFHRFLNRCNFGQAFHGGDPYILAVIH